MAKNFVSVSNLCESRRSHFGRPSYSKDDVVFATDYSGTKHGERYAMRVSVPMAVAKKARIIAGDRVDVLFDQGSREGLVKRVNSGGWKLCETGKSGSRLYVKVSFVFGMPSTVSPVACPCEVTDEGIVFMLPEEVGFGENLRERADNK
jgi:hypothetical protein